MENSEIYNIAQCNHERNLYNYYNRINKPAVKRAFESVISAYKLYRNDFEAIQDFTEEGIEHMVQILNDYRSVSIPVFDKLDNSGQKALGYTIMEEFFYLFFQKYVYTLHLKNENLFLGKGNSYVSLSFTPKSFLNSLTDVSPYIHSKDQDFVLGIKVDINIKSGDYEGTKPTVLPVIAIECKTYLEKNMLDSCANTASRLKKAMPYCVYMVAAEYMKMDEASPELTDIDEVYILCKAKNSERLKRAQQGLTPLGISADLILDLFNRVKRHLNAIWWSPEEAITNGKVISRPM